MMNETVIIAIISFFGTLLGTFGGIVTSSKLTNYRIEQLEKKVESMGVLAYRIPIIEEKIKILQKEINHENFKMDDCSHHNNSFSGA